MENLNYKPSEIKELHKKGVIIEWRFRDGEEIWMEKDSDYFNFGTKDYRVKNTPENIKKIEEIKKSHPIKRKRNTNKI